MAATTKTQTLPEKYVEELIARIGKNLEDRISTAINNRLPGILESLRILLKQDTVATIQDQIIEVGIDAEMLIKKLISDFNDSKLENPVQDLRISDEDILKLNEYDSLCLRIRDLESRSVLPGLESELNRISESLAQLTKWAENFPKLGLTEPTQSTGTDVIKNRCLIKFRSILKPVTMETYKGDVKWANRLKPSMEFYEIFIPQLSKHQWCYMVVHNNYLNTANIKICSDGGTLHTISIKGGGSPIWGEIGKILADISSGAFKLPQL